jgi:hypothetical protein
MNLVDAGRYPSADVRIPRRFRTVRRRVAHFGCSGGWVARLNRRRMRWAPLAVAFIICTGCIAGPPPAAGSSSPTATVAPSSRSVGPSGPRILGSTCTEYAQGFELAAQSGRGFDAPEVQSAEVDRQTIYVSVQMASGYSGPGTYDSRRNSSFAAYASQDELNPYNPSGTVTVVFMPRIRGFTTLTVKADGSGVLQLTDWTQVSGAVGGGPISVSITWICQQ